MGAEMSITALVAAAAIVIAAAGFGAGWGLRPVPDTADAIEEVAATIEAQGEAIASVAEAAGRPVVIDAELRSTLAEVSVGDVPPVRPKLGQPPGMLGGVRGYDRGARRMPRAPTAGAVGAGRSGSGSHPARDLTLGRLAGCVYPPGLCVGHDKP